MLTFVLLLSTTASPLQWYSSPDGVVEHFEEKRREALSKQRAAARQIETDKRAEEERARVERQVRAQQCQKRQFALPPMNGLSNATPEREQYLELPRVFATSVQRLSVMTGVEFEVTPAQPLLLLDDCVETLVVGLPSRVEGGLIIQVGRMKREDTSAAPPSCAALREALTKRTSRAPPLRHADWAPAFIVSDVASVEAASGRVTQRLGYGTPVLQANAACGLIASEWGLGFVDVAALGAALDDDASLKQRELKATSKARWAAVRALQSPTKEALTHATRLAASVPTTKAVRCREVQPEVEDLEQVPSTGWKVNGAPAVFRAAWLYEPSECDCCDCERCATWLRVELDVPGGARDVATCE